MSIQFDANKAMDSPKSGKFTMALMAVVTISLVVIIVIALANGKHNKITKDGIETNIPPGDTAKEDHSTHINVKGDYIQGDKIVKPSDKNK